MLNPFQPCDIRLFVVIRLTLQKLCARNCMLLMETILSALCKAPQNKNIFKTLKIIHYYELSGIFFRSNVTCLGSVFNKEKSRGSSSSSMGSSWHHNSRSDSKPDQDIANWAFRVLSFGGKLAWIKTSTSCKVSHLRNKFYCTSRSICFGLEWWFLMFLVARVIMLSYNKLVECLGAVIAA